MITSSRTAPLPPPNIHTHKTFSTLHGNGVPMHTAYNRTYFPSTLLMQRCYPIPPMLPPRALKTMRMRRGPSPSERSPWQRQHLPAKHTKTFSQRFLPHSSRQSKKGREVTERGKSMKYLHWFMFVVLGLIDGKCCSVINCALFSGIYVILQNVC